MKNAVDRKLRETAAFFGMFYNHVIQEPKTNINPDEICKFDICKKRKSEGNLFPQLNSDCSAQDRVGVVPHGDEDRNELPQVHGRRENQGAEPEDRRVDKDLGSHFDIQ